MYLLFDRIAKATAESVAERPPTFPPPTGDPRLDWKELLNDTFESSLYDKWNIVLTTRWFSWQLWAAEGSFIFYEKRIPLFRQTPEEKMFLRNVRLSAKRSKEITLRNIFDKSRQAEDMLLGSLAPYKERT